MNMPKIKRFIERSESKIAVPQYNKTRTLILRRTGIEQSLGEQ